jgi:hypothetical protein
VGEEACWSLAETLSRAGEGTLRELGSMEERELNDLRKFASCVSNTVFNQTHPVVKVRACAMIDELAREGFLTSSNPSDVVSQGYRTPADAHRLSTAYHNYFGFIDSETLRCHPIDVAGNVWYDPVSDPILDAACAQSFWG